MLFFCSGLSSLVYQTLWLRMLSLVFGITVYAAATVLAGFMAGLAIGSILGGRIGDRLRSPLLGFAVVEILIAVTALATSLGFEAVQAVYARLHHAMLESLAVLTAVRFACSFAVLIIPTALMGATSPLVMKAAVRDLAEAGPSIALLYGVNTAGAITGALLAGFVLIGGIGVRSSFLLAASLNVIVGLTAAALARRSLLIRPISQAPERAGGTEVPRLQVGRRDQESPAVVAVVANPGEPHGQADDPAEVRQAVLIAMGLSGFCALALEVVWFRVLVLYTDATTYAFSTLLAAVLLGLATGSLAVRPLMRRSRHWGLMFAIVQALVGIAAVASLAGHAVAYTAGWRVGDALKASILLALPATFLMGMSFPIGVALRIGGQTNAASQAARRIGLVYAANLTGAILGSVIAGFVLLPWLGTRTSLIVVASINLLAAGLVLWATPARRDARSVATIRNRMLTAAAVAIVFVVCAFATPDPMLAAHSQRYPRGERLFWREEGVQTTVAVNQNPMGWRVLYLNGLHQADDTRRMVSTHRLIGALPMALHPLPRRALVIGLGGGATAGIVSQHSGVQLDVVELSDSVVRGAAWFAHVNYDLLRRPNVRVRIDDGRNFLMLSARDYDVLTADIIQPMHAGAGALYSVEYFRLAGGAVKDDGIVMQWIGRREDAHYRLIMRTFLTVFPHTTLWEDGSLMVGTKQPLKISQSAYARKLADPMTATALRETDLDGFDKLLVRYTAGPDELRHFLGDGPVLTDDRPLIEYYRSISRDRRPVDLTGVVGDVRRHVTP
jgi:spermidine synthase